MARKKSKKKLIAGILAAALVAGGGSSFYMRAQQAQKAAEELAKASQIRSAQVTRSTIADTVSGSGTLAAGDAEDIPAPTGIQIEKLLVEEGDHVTEGQTLATVNTASIDSAIADIQTSIATIDEQLEDLEEDGESKTVTSSISGRVKAIYAAADEDVGDILKEHGALMLISADGLMAVDLADEAASGTSVLSSLTVGDTVTVIRADDSELEGTVAALSSDGVTVTVTDDGPGLDEEVTVRTSNGTVLGSGRLYVHQELKVTASSGTVSSVSVSENTKVSQGTTLLKLKDVTDTVTRNELLSSRSELTDHLEDMLRLRETGVIVSTVTGTVSAVNVEEGEEVTKTAAASTATQDSVSSSVKYSSSPFTVLTGIVTLASAAEDSENDAADGTADTASASSASKNAASESKSASEPTAITAVSVPLSQPSAGSAPDDSIRTTLNTALGDSPYKASAIDWAMGGDSVFAAGTYHEAVVTLTPADGYAFSGSADIKVSGGGEYKTARLMDNGDLQVLIAFTYPAEDPTPAETETTPTEAAPTQAADPTQAGDPAQAEDPTQAAENVTPSAGTDPAADTAATPTGTADAAGVTSGSDSAAPTVSPTASPSASGSSTGGSGSLTGSSSGASGSLSGSSSGASGSSISLSGSSSGSSASGTAADTSASGTSDLYSSYETAAFQVTSDDYMTVSISVDELDILSISEGQKAAIELDALDGQVFEGTVDEINTTGSNSGGSTKYTVSIKIPKEDQMLVGMSATATITVKSAEDVLTIPVSAVQERGPQAYVYTEQAEDGTLSGEVTIETGMSTDNLVEVTSGLAEGQTIYYEQLTGSDISTESAEDMMQMGMGGQGGPGGNGGEPPSGDFGGGPGGSSSGPGGSSGGPGGN